MEEDFDSKLENLSRDLIYLKQELQRASSMEKLSILAQIRNVEMEILQTVRCMICVNWLPIIQIQNLVLHRLIKVRISLGKSQLHGHTQCISFIPSFNTVFLFGIIIAWT